MLELHDHVVSAESYTVRLMLALLGRTYQAVAVDAYPGTARAPVLVDGDVRLDEPGLIITHLARRYGPRWLPQDGAQDVAGWLDFTATGLKALSDARRVAVLGAQGDLAALNMRGRRALRTVEDSLVGARIDGRAWLVGAHPTIADIAVFPHVMLSHDSGIGHEDYPAINLWQRGVRRLPGFIGMPGIPDYF